MVWRSRLRVMLVIGLLCAGVLACNLPSPEESGQPPTRTPSAASATASTISATKGPEVASPVPVKLPDSDTPAAGICAETDDGIVQIRILDPPPPDPRCLQVTADQRLSVLNDTENEIRVRLAHYDRLVPPGGETTLELPMGEYLAPGVHSLSPAGEIWLIAGP